MPARTTETKTILNDRAVERTLKRMADEIVELNDGTDNLVIVGIQRRGVQLARRISALIEESENAKVLQGSLDITLYRDDLQTVGPRPVVGPTDIPWAIDGRNVVIVDYLLYTGDRKRTRINCSQD
jgi:pyrimidine operon attenuation protein/uracil phosphoribosyltransferase